MTSSTRGKCLTTEPTPILEYSRNMVVGAHAPRIKEVKTVKTVKMLKQGVAFKRCGPPAGSGRLPVLSGPQPRDCLNSMFFRSLW